MSGGEGGHTQSVPQVMEAMPSHARRCEMSVALHWEGGSRLGAVQGQREVNTQGVGQ